MFHLGCAFKFLFKKKKKFTHFHSFYQLSLHLGGNILLQVYLAFIHLFNVLLL